jgi:hypothetical protein
MVEVTYHLFAELEGVTYVVNIFLREIYIITEC